MRMRTRHRRLFGLVCAVLPLCAVEAFLVWGPVLGAFNRAVRMPWIVHAAFIETVSWDASAASTQRRRLLDAWSDGGEYGLHRVQPSVEGDPIGLWLIASKGRLTLVTDYSRDDHSTRGIGLVEPVSIELAMPRPGDQHPLRAWFPRDDETYLRCTLSNGGTSFF
jgi:hypothetical protein